MNHRDTINPHFVVTRSEAKLDNLPQKEAFSKQQVEAIMQQMGVSERYMKHYFPQPEQLKVFLSGGSSLIVDISSGEAVYVSPLALRSSISGTLPFGGPMEAELFHGGYDTP